MQMPCAWLLCKLPLGRDMLAGSKWCYSGKRLMSLLTFSAFQVHHFPSVPQFTNLLNSVILVSLCKVLIMNSNQEVRATKAENRSLFRSLQFLHIKNPQQHYHQNSAKKGLCDIEQSWTWISHAALLFIT